MKKYFKNLPLVCWSLAKIVTVLVYCLLVDNIFSSTVKILSLIFVILAEAIMCIKFLSKKQSIIMNTQMLFGGAYLLITVILSIIYSILVLPSVKWFIAIHVFLLALLTIADLTVLNFNNRAEKADERVFKNKNLVSSCGILIDVIIAENADSEFKKELLSISELIRYSDNSVLSGDELTILEKLEELKEIMSTDKDSESIIAKIKDIKTLIKVREIYIKQNQRGKF